MGTTSNVILVSENFCFQEGAGLRLASMQGLFRAGISSYVSNQVKRLKDLATHGMFLIAFLNLKMDWVNKIGMRAKANRKNTLPFAYG